MKLGQQIRCNVNRLALGPVCCVLLAGHLSAIARAQLEEAYRGDVAPPGGWKLADLEATMKSLQARSYANGRRMFERAHCAKCHRFNNVGVEFGPDLAKLDVRFQPVDILRDILDPSRRIADARYDLWVFETASGRVVSGLIRRQTEQTVEVMERPPDEAPPTVLHRSQIERRWMSLASIMPQGLLDRFTRDEIADLAAYVAARGDPSDPLVRKSASTEPAQATAAAPAGSRPPGCADQHGVAAHGPRVVRRVLRCGPSRRRPATLGHGRR